MREAAAIPLIFITAWEALVDRAQTGPGKTVLIHGGAGGVGHIAVQLAKARGAQGQGRAHHGEILTNASALIEAGKLLPLLDPAEYTLETIAEAYAAIESHRATGKVVITL